MTKKMAEMGVDAVLVVTPCYFKSLMNNQALVQHYTKVTELIKYERCLCDYDIAKIGKVRTSARNPDKCESIFQLGKVRQFETI